jgi:hypothetical protein
MGLDIRMPIGLMFGTIGVMLTVYGLISDSAIYERSLGMNVNVEWGVVMIVFGVIMTVLGRIGSKRQKAAAPANADAAAPPHGGARAAGGH